MVTKNQQMISLKEALNIATKYTKILGTEDVNFSDSLGRVLAEDIYSDVDMPPFNKSAMDGYACKKEDIGKALEVLEIIPAGNSPTKIVGQGQCSKIMTGAEVPEGADTVIMVEFTEENENGKIVFAGSKTSSNICLTGEDLKKGDLVLNKGILLEPQHIAMLASVGCTSPKVYQQPSIGIISTGSELIEPHESITEAKIRNSNGPQMVAQAKKMGLPVNYYGIVADDQQQTLKKIKKSTEENDLTLVSGGVSVGDFDFVPWAIKEVGFEILFNKIAVKPGMHTTFAIEKEKGLEKEKYIIGLPGNPVSSFIQFEIFAKEVIYKLMGITKKQILIPMEMKEDFTRGKTNKEELIPISLDTENKVERIIYNGSAHIHAYHDAFGVISIAMGKQVIKKGEIVYVRPL